MATESAGGDLIHVVALLTAGVVAVPIFKRLGLGSILGYLSAGVIIGPFALGIFSDAEAILHVAELGVVMFLFIIGLEMQPTRLWGMRREIFGLGTLQVGFCALLLTGVGIATGRPVAVSFPHRAQAGPRRPQHLPQDAQQPRLLVGVRSRFA